MGNLLSCRLLWYLQGRTLRCVCGGVCQESLGGNAKTSLVIAVANALQHVDETLQSLQFGSRAMRVHTQACLNPCMICKALWLIRKKLPKPLSHVQKLALRGTWCKDPAK